MNDIQLGRLDLNLLVVFEALMETGSVSAAAKRLGKTPSAVSHALARLREQLGDPLMVKVGGKMQPSPYAKRLIEDVRPILSAIRRAVSQPASFDPATSQRVFRVAIATWPSLMSRVYGRMNAEAPQAVLDWTGPKEGVLNRLADGAVDLVVTGETAVPPEGITKQILPQMRVFTFARAGHPAVASWTREAWSRWPHIMIELGTSYRNTVEKRIGTMGLERTIGARFPDFGAIGPLLNATDFLSNGFMSAMLDAVDAHDLVVLEPPLRNVTGTVAMFWNSRLERDPAIAWLRALVSDCFQQLQQDAEAYASRCEVVPLKD